MSNWTLCAWTLIFVCLSAGASAEQVYYVSPDGNDALSGQNREVTADDGPFATLARAADAIRDARATGEAVTVRVLPGTHFLTQPLVLTPAHSGTAEAPVHITGEPGAEVSGGRRITGWRRGEDSLWTTTLGDVKEHGWHFRILRVGDRWARRARHPNWEPYALSERPGDYVDAGWLFAKPPHIPPGQGLFGVGVSNIHNRGDRLEWVVDVPAGGACTVWVRYGHNMKRFGRDNMDNATVLGVADGNETPLANLPDTGSWSASRWANAATLHLPAGEHRLYWENRKGGGLDLDAFVLTNAAGWDPNEGLVIQSDGRAEIHEPDQGHVLVVHAESCDKAIGPEIRVGDASKKASKEWLYLAPSEFPEWDDWAGADVHIFPAWGWVNTVLTVKEVDAEAYALRLDSGQELRPGNRYFIEGVRAALDEPGEWHLDGDTGVLTYWPEDGDFAGENVVAPAMDRLFVLKGDEDAYAEHIHISGLTFRDTDYSLGEYYEPSDAAVWLSKARQCRVEDCTFRTMAGYGVRIGEASRGNEVLANDMEGIGQGGVIVAGREANRPSGNLIAANRMHGLGAIYKHVAGVYVTCGSGNRIANNDIRRVPRYGISLKTYDPGNFSHGNVVEYNILIDSNRETNDTGAIETLGRDKKNTGNVIRYNLIRNVVGFKTSPTGEIWTPHFTWGIYLDDYSSGTTVLGNVVDGTVIGGVCIHGGKDNRIENNVFLNASEQQLRLQPRDDFMQGNLFVRNIVAYHAEESVLWYAYDRTWRPDRLAQCDDNIYWCYGDLDIATTDRSITPEGSYRDWLATGFDAHSVVADPLLRDPEKGEYGLRPGSPALEQGFEPIPFDKMGPEAFER